MFLFPRGMVQELKLFRLDSFSFVGCGRSSDRTGCLCNHHHWPAKMVRLKNQPHPTTGVQPLTPPLPGVPGSKWHALTGGYRRGEVSDAAIQATRSVAAGSFSFVGCSRSSDRTGCLCNHHHRPAKMVRLKNQPHPTTALFGFPFFSFLW